MAEAGLFIGWGEPVTGREAKGLEVFAEALAYWATAEQDGRIESSETVLLNPHGGDLAGFTLARGSEAQMSAVRAEDAFDPAGSPAQVERQPRMPGRVHHARSHAITRGEHRAVLARGRAFQPRTASARSTMPPGTRRAASARSHPGTRPAYSFPRAAGAR